MTVRASLSAAACEGRKQGHCGAAPPDPGQRRPGSLAPQCQPEPTVPGGFRPSHESEFKVRLRRRSHGCGGHHDWSLTEPSLRPAAAGMPLAVPVALCCRNRLVGPADGSAARSRGVGSACDIRGHSARAAGFRAIRAGFPATPGSRRWPPAACRRSERHRATQKLAGRASAY